MEKEGKKKIQYFDYNLLVVIIFLVGFGLIMLCSVSLPLFKKQLFIGVAGIVVMLVVSLINYKWYAYLSLPLYFVSFVLMGLVLTPLGIEHGGAKRWIALPFGQEMQPSEVTKVAVIILVPYIICCVGKHIEDYRVALFLLFVGVAAAGGVWLMTDNLSTAIIVLGIVCVVVFVAHPKTAPFIIFAGIMLVLVIIVLLMIDGKYDGKVDKETPFRIVRILSWIHPEKYQVESNYQSMQGLYAIGSGGFFGKGLGNGVQKVILPEAENDMILAVVGEELGVFGLIIMLFLFGMLIYRLAFIAQNAPDRYGALVVIGILSHISIQVIFNFAVVLKIFPTTGITLPFFSNGGTALLILLGEMGIALGVSRKIQLEE